MPESLNNLIWIDLEMTGLDPKMNVILEIATIITDDNLNILEEGPSLSIFQKEEQLSLMDDWNIQHHTSSGLISRVKKSPVSESSAEKDTIAFISKYVKKGASPLCGNTIGQDRLFLTKYMPELTSWFHYRNIDVTTIKELAKRWAPNVFEGVKKANSHQAMEDIKESINELAHYRKHFLRY